MILDKQIKEIFTSYLKMLAKETGSTPDKVQAVIWSNAEMNDMPLFLGVGPEKWIMDENNRPKTYNSLQIIGTLTSITLAALNINLDEEIYKVLKVIKKDEEINTGLNIRCICADEFARELFLFVYSQNTQIKQLDWEYVIDIIES